MSTILSLFALAFAAAGEPTPVALLRAHISGNTAWVARLSSDAKGCQVSVTRGVGKGQIVEKAQPPLADCRAMLALVDPATSELKNDPPRPTRRMDEPDYELRIKDRFGGVDFSSPEVCELDATGTLKCKTNALSNAQQLLLRLRAYARKGPR